MEGGTEYLSIVTKKKKNVVQDVFSLDVTFFINLTKAFYKYKRQHLSQS